MGDSRYFDQDTDGNRVPRIKDSLTYWHQIATFIILPMLGAFLYTLYIQFETLKTSTTQMAVQIGYIEKAVARVEARLDNAHFGGPGDKQR